MASSAPIVFPKPPIDRVAARFRALADQGRAGLITFTMAGDPDPETGFRLLSGLVEAGADLIELGMPFSDPMADGPAIQAAGLRALKAGMTLEKVLAQVTRFRQADADTPVILMGYYNPIYRFGVGRFLDAALAAGVDGLIVVDLPPEEDGELCVPALKAGLHFIRLATPTTDGDRAPAVLANTSGFVYYVSVTGITGAAAADGKAVGAAVDRLRAATRLPIAVGFGIKTPDQAAEVARAADAAVVGSAIVTRIADSLSAGGATEATVPSALGLVRDLAAGVRAARA